MPIRIGSFFFKKNLNRRNLLAIFLYLLNLRIKSCIEKQKVTKSIDKTMISYQKNYTENAYLEQLQIIKFEPILIE